MICIAAFIILLAVWLCTPIMKLFGFKKQAKNINTMFKKSMHCFSRRATFRACDSNFADEIKNSILRKLIVRHKKWVKPVSIGIEVGSFLIILVTIWSTLTVLKSGLALYVYGTCDVKKPDSCALNTAEACTIDGVSGGNPIVEWFTEWGEIFSALPVKMTKWNADDFTPKNGTFYGEFGGKSVNSNEVAVDFFDPGCIICRRSFINQKNSGFLDSHKTYVLPYVIRGENGDKFKNSEILARFIEAVRSEQPENGEKISAEWVIVENLFTKKSEDGTVWQEMFNGQGVKTFTAKEAKNTIKTWLKNAGFTDSQIENISKKADSKEITEKLNETRDIVENKIKTKRIPTMIFENTRHEGLYKAEK